MGAKRVLLMHISNISGHRCASLAIEKALRELDQHIQTYAIDAFHYISPFWEKFINTLYIFVVKFYPRFWDYLYDNENVLKKIKKIRSLVHRANEQKMQRLFAEIMPDIVVCTQAFPCGIVADYKRRYNLKIPLVGVLTDFAPHLYWVNKQIDSYVVPAPKIKQIMVRRGIPEERLNTLGIPIDNKFTKPVSREQTCQKLGLDKHLPTILIMGGGQGLGPIKQISLTLDKLSKPIQLIVVCGTNRRLYQWLNINKSKFNHPISVIGYTEQINELMSISSFAVGKPGGLSSAEALSKSLPMIIMNPLPGQENKNTQFLLETGAAMKVDNFASLLALAEELLANPERLNCLRQRAKAMAYTDSALGIARLILEITK
jgi:processive 1,2-diacylglycerol beta-glucosyltransferase